jgi:hypothetical protein
MKQKGRKRTDGMREITNAMELAQIEEKAHLFYKLAVVKDRKYRFRNYRSTFVGKEMVDSMVASGLAESREQAVVLGCTIGKSFDLFENCENRYLNKMPFFEDQPNRFYRFSSGALVLIRKIHEREVNAEKAIAATSSGRNGPGRGPGLQRQNGTRKIGSCEYRNEEDVTVCSVFNRHKRLMNEMKVTARLPISPIFEEDNEMGSSRESNGVSKTNKIGRGVKGNNGIQRQMREQSKLESASSRAKLSRQKKAEAEKTKILRHRYFTQDALKNNDKLFGMRTSAHSIIETIGNKEDNARGMNRKGKNPDDSVPPSKEAFSKFSHTKYDTEGKKVGAKDSGIRRDDCRIIKTRNQENMEQKRDDRGTPRILEFAMQERRVATLPTEPDPIAEKGKPATTPLQTNFIANQQNLDGVMERAEQVDPEADESDGEILPFVTSPQDLPAGLRRRMSDNIDNFDNFEFILNMKEGNLLTNYVDGDSSVWTEFIIGDKEGREKYRENEMKRRRQSHTSCVKKSIAIDDEICSNEFTVLKNGTVFDEKVVASKWRPSVRLESISKNGNEKCIDDQSYMGYTVFDNTIAVSYVEDDEDHKGSESSLEEDDRVLFHVFADRDSMSCDDDMTQITMDQALTRPPANNPRNLSIYPSAPRDRETDNFNSTSKSRIQQILWNDLYNRDFPVVRSAMEELRKIVASEPESRKKIVRMGGVMAIMGTMEKYLELETMQYYCCVIIELLASMEPEARRAFDEMKVIQLIVRSMQEQARSDRVQEAGRAALGTLF